MNFRQVITLWVSGIMLGLGISNMFPELMGYLRTDGRMIAIGIVVVMIGLLVIPDEKRNPGTS